MTTSNAINITEAWLNLNQYSGIPAGSKVCIQNVGAPNDLVIISMSDSEPSADDRGWSVAPYAEIIEVGKGEPAVWARALKRSGSDTSSAYIQFSTESVTNSPSGSGVTITPETPKNKTLNSDAWSRPKAVIDKSIIHGMFTFNVPAPTWKESINTVEQLSFTYSTSVSGKLNLVSNGITNDKVKIDTFRNPRYEPNRGHLYSISAFLPDVDRLGQRSFGIFTEDAGVMFRLKSDGMLYAVRRTTIGGAMSEVEEGITIPAGVDLTKGNTFDIQFQWRGVGNYYYFINQQLVLAQEDIGTLTELSMSDPASPIAFECINQGDDVIIQCGCVDVSSEGGEDNGKTYGSISVNNDAGQVAISGFNQPVMAVRNKKLFGSMVNTRDMISLLATGYSDQKSVMRVWTTRDETAITLNSQVWDDFGDGHIERIVNGLNVDGTALVGTAMTFDTTKAQLVFGARVDIDRSYATSALFEGRTNIYQTPGDIFIFTMHRENGGSSNAGVTYEFAESI